MKVLGDIRVLDLGSFITGPYCAMLLGDLGADVIKVERPGTGDPFRMFAQGGYSSEFQAHNRNKRSITLDYTSAEGRQILAGLIAGADVLLLNSRPGVAEKNGLSYNDVRAINARTIYCTISGFGASGPSVHRPAFDTVGQCLSGWLSQFHSNADPRVAGPAVCDMVTGFFAAYGILAALHERATTGHGRHVEVNMIDAMLAFGTEPIGRLLNKGDKSDAYTRGSFSQAFIFECADGRRIGIHMSSPEKFWTGLQAAIDQPELAADTRFRDRHARVANYKALGEKLMPIFQRQPRAHWMQRLDANDVPFAPMYDLDELRDDPQIIELAPFVEMNHPVFGHVTGIKRPVRFDGDRMIDYRPPPALGEHTAEVLAEYGIDHGHLLGLLQRKVV